MPVPSRSAHPIARLRERLRPRPRQRVRPRARPGLTAALAVLSLISMPGPASAQTLPEVTATPEETTTLFLRSVRAIRWRAAAQFIHPATLTRFHDLVTMMSRVDTTGQVRRYLTDTDSAGYATLSASQVFDRSIGTMIDDMPGLMHALFDRDDDVLGHVAEAGDTAHVVYRTTARISGAVSEVKVMQLAHTPDGWRVSWSDELEVLEAALRGVPRSQPDPPGTTPAGTTP